MNALMAKVLSNGPGIACYNSGAMPVHDFLDKHISTDSTLCCMMLEALRWLLSVPAKQRFEQHGPPVGFKGAQTSGQESPGPGWRKPLGNKSSPCHPPATPRPSQGYKPVIQRDISQGRTDEKIQGRPGIPGL